MHISVNGEPLSFTGHTVADLIQQQAVEPPFAVAVNTVFVAQQRYAVQGLHEGDQIDIVQPVVGG